MVRRGIRLLSAVAIVTGLSASMACGHRPPNSRAAVVCRRALGSSLLNSTPATVAEVRSFAMGPAVTPLTNVFPGEDGSAFAAWCSAKKSADGYTAYAVDGTGRKVRVVTISGNGGKPSGEPMVP